MSIIENWDFHSNNLSNIDLNLMSFSETIPPHAKVFICIDEGVNVSQHTHLPCLMDRFQILLSAFHFPGNQAFYTDALGTATNLSTIQSLACPTEPTKSTTIPNPYFSHCNIISMLSKKPTVGAE
jgi:hypothetical protein